MRDQAQKGGGRHVPESGEGGGIPAETAEQFEGIFRQFVVVQWMITVEPVDYADFVAGKANLVIPRCIRFYSLSVTGSTVSSQGNSAKSFIFRVYNFLTLLFFSVTASCKSKIFAEG